MPRRKAKVKKFKLDIKRAKADVGRSITKAERALTAGRKALARARKKGDADLILANEEALKDNRQVLSSLKVSFQALGDTCVDQFLNSDPVYEG